VNTGRPWFPKYVFASLSIVGDAYASTIATVTPCPSFPLAIAFRLRTPTAAACRHPR
jgi:hypothetical protein